MGNGHIKKISTKRSGHDYAETDDSAPTSSSGASLPVPLDGGYGWVVCAASFVSMVISDGIMFSFGVFFIELLDYFQEGVGKTAMVGSLLVGVSLLGGKTI